MKDGRMA